jgi:hypothetical protein
MTYSKEKWIFFICLAIVLTVVTYLMSGVEKTTLKVILVFFGLSCLSSFLITNVIFRFLRKKQ